MTKQKFIFDLDGTLLTCNYKELEDDFFKSIFKEESDRFIPYISKLLDEYENTHKRYTDSDLSLFLKRKTDLEFTEQIIRDWVTLMENISDNIEDGVIDVLEHLKSKDYNLEVLTNWYGNSQESRLKNAGIYDYFDNIHTGDIVLKPHKEAYLKAVGDTDIERCILIGDNLYKDYIAPRMYGLDSIFYDKKEKEGKQLVKIRHLNELKDRY